MVACSFSYNNAGETEGCEAWYFWVTPTGKLTGVVTDEVTGLPIENVEIFIEQLSGDFNTTILQMPMEHASSGVEIG